MDAIGEWRGQPLHVGLCSTLDGVPLRLTPHGHQVMIEEEAHQRAGEFVERMEFVRREPLVDGHAI